MTGPTIIRPTKVIPDVRRLSLIALLMIPAIACAEYKVPSADDRESSPPSVSGKVIELSGNLIIVDSRGQEISVLTNADTHIFTSYGGIIYLHEICPDSKIEIWFRSPDENPKIAYAVSIRVPESC